MTFAWMCKYSNAYPVRCLDEWSTPARCHDGHQQRHDFQFSVLFDSYSLLSASCWRLSHYYGNPCGYSRYWLHRLNKHLWFHHLHYDSTDTKENQMRFMCTVNTRARQSQTNPDFCMRVVCFREQMSFSYYGTHQHCKLERAPDILQTLSLLGMNRPYLIPCTNSNLIASGLKPPQ